MEDMMPIVKKLAENYAYHRLESLIYIFEEGNFTPTPSVVRRIKRRIKMSFLIVKRKISHEMRTLRKSGASNTTIVDFYTLVRRFLPAFPKFYKLNI